MDYEWCEGYDHRFYVQLSLMNTKQKVALILLGGAVAYYLYEQYGGGGCCCPVVCGNCPPSSGNGPGIGTSIMSAVQGWKNVNSGPTWVPVLNQYEQQNNLPADILAATAYQESAFDENVIRGLKASSDGLSLGIMQLQTAYFPSVNVATPFADSDVEAQIAAAAQVFVTNYAALGSWPETIAAFNQGLAGVQKNGITSTKYVNNITGNAPAANA
jgi:Transglycosylase SLT domain